MTKNFEPGKRLTRFPLKRSYQSNVVLDTQINMLEQILLPQQVFWDNVRKVMKYGI